MNRLSIESAALLGSLDRPATLLASYGVSDITGFSRAVAAGFTGNGESAFQREAAMDVIRSSHYVGALQCVLLQDAPSPCMLVAPGTPAVTPGELKFSATFSAIPVTASLLRYQYRLDGAGPWISNGTSTTLTDIAATVGSHTLSVGAVSTSGVAGATVTSPSFVVDSAAGLALLSHLEYSPDAGSATTPGLDTRGADLIVVFVGSYHDWQATTLTDSKGNTWIALTDWNGAGHAGRFFYCFNPVVDAAHTFTPNVVLTFFTFIGVMAFTGIGSGSFHSENGANTDPSRPGPVTPVANGSLILSGVFNYAVGDSPTINSGFTGFGVAKSGNIGMGGMAYLIQDIAASINPTWTSTGAGGSGTVAIIADFAP